MKISTRKTEVLCLSRTVLLNLFRFRLPLQSNAAFALTLLFNILPM